MLPQFQTPSIFLGLFLRKLEVQDFQTFAESLPWRLPEFNADPQLARLPPDAPPDTPRVRFHSKDGRLLLEVAPAKIHFRMMPGEITQTPQGQANLKTLPVPQAYEKFIPQAMRVQTALSEHFGATASRIGVITDIIAPVPSSANQRLQQHLLTSKNLFGERLQELQIQAMARVSLDGTTNVNRRIVIRPVRTGQEGHPDLIINVNVDINTLAEEPYDITAADLESFLKNVVQHLEKRVPLLNEAALFQ